MDFKGVLDHAKLIPTNDINSDLNCLEELFRKSSIYFDFCYSWFIILIKKGHTSEIISKLEQIVQNEIQPNRYLPILDIILTYSDPEESSSFITSLVSSYTKFDNVSSSVLIHPNFHKIKTPLLTKLFNIFPNKSEDWQIIQIRDNLLFRCISAGNQNKLALNCLMRIPATHSNSFYQEFLKIATYLIESGCKDPLLSTLIINLIYITDSKEPLVHILANSSLPVPQLFIDYLSEDQVFLDNQAIPEFNKSLIFDGDFASLPPFLRKRKILPYLTKLDGPRLCRLPPNQKNSQWNTIINQRIHEEIDPKMLHDYLLSSCKYFPLESPFRYTLLANAAYSDPNLMNGYYSQFSELNPGARVDYLLAASKGLEKLSIKDSSAAVVTFPVIRSILDMCSEKLVRNSLLNTIARAVGDGKIDAEFVWRDYHSIRTVPTEGLEFEDLVHYSAIALDDPLDSDVAESLLLELNKKDSNSVISSLWRLPTEIIQKHSSIADLMPKESPSDSMKDDPLPHIIHEELQKEQTTQRMLQIATAFVMFYDIFEANSKKTNSKQIKIIKFAFQDWMKILMKAGECVFEMKIDKTFYEEVINQFKKSDNEKVRFSCGFAIALFLSYRLIDPVAEFSLCEDIRKACLEDKSNIVRLISLYAASLCPPPNYNSEVSVNQFIKTIVDRGRGHNCVEDLIGIGYCIRSWFSHIVKLLNDNQKWKTSMYLWPFLADIDVFLNLNQITIIEQDEIGIAQFIYLQRSNPEFDKMADQFASSDNVKYDTLLVSVCGYVPSLAFRMNQFCMDERQRKIISSANSNEFDLINQLLSRERQSHQPVEKSEKAQKYARSMTEKLKSDWMNMEDSEVQVILTALSASQIGDIIKDEDQDYALFTSISKRLIPDTARLLAAHRWSNEMMKRVNDVFSNDSFSALVTEMCRINAKIERLADLVVYHNMNELLSEEKSVLLLPSYLAEITPMKDTIADYGKQMPLFANCLILINPSFFESNEEQFSNVFD